MARKQKIQASKRARLHRKQALWAFGDGQVARWFAHPSHFSGRRWLSRHKLK